MSNTICTVSRDIELQIISRVNHVCGHSKQMGGGDTVVFNTNNTQEPLRIGRPHPTNPPAIMLLHGGVWANDVQKNVLGFARYIIHPILSLSLAW